MYEQEPPIEILPMFPQELKDLTQWVNWEYRNDTKTPTNPRTGGNAMVNQPSTWNTFDAAVERGAKYNLGLGFVLTESDPYTCIDLDHCLGKGGVKNEPALSIVEAFKGQAYIEASPSRSGLHLWTRNAIPVNRRTPNIEIYSSGRWITASGFVNPSAPLVVEIPDGTNLVQWLLSQYFTKEAPVTNYRASQEVLEHDQEVWQRLFNSKNGSTFQALFNGDVSVTYNDHSRGVIFLANMLAMMTNGDAGRMKSLLYQTGLVNEKWESKRGSVSWIDHQIQSAILWSSGKKKQK
jgi:putative DNA primase/helicase